MKLTKITTAIIVPTLLALALLSSKHGRHSMATAMVPAVTGTRALAAMRMPNDPTQVDKTIQCFEARVKRDPIDAIDYNILSGCFLQRCRETGDIADAQRAEAAARRSLAIRTRNNSAALDALARSLFTQHRFPEARAIASRVARARIDDPQAAATLAEIEAESGQYAAAHRHLAALTGRDAGGPLALALDARLLEFHGGLSESERLLERAAETADNDFDLPRENVAWFHFRIGNIRAERGDADGANVAYMDALAWDPHDYKTMLGLAKVDAGRNQWKSAILWGERSAAIVPTPEAIAVLVDCYQATGDKVHATADRNLIEAMRRLSKSQGTIYDRQRAMYCADHNVHLGEALDLAHHELTMRHDIYAYDTLGWVEYRCGMLKDAKASLTKALATGSRDALLYYHLGMIEAALHHKADATRHLELALKLNPYFHPFGPQIARETLTRLAHEASTAKAPHASVVVWEV